MKFVKQIFLFALFSLLTLILCEIFIRTSHLASVSPTDFYDDIGRGNRKDFQYVYFNEGFGIGRYNQYRYIGTPHAHKKENNTIRIALLGDSFIEAHQVFERNHFSEVTLSMLKEIHPNKNFEFLNFGRSGFDIADMYATHEILVKNFNPDYVLYIMANDDLVPKYTDQLRPKTLVEKGSLRIIFDYELSEFELFQTTKYLTQNSSILNMLNIGRKKTQSTPFLSIILDKAYYWFCDNLVVKSNQNDKYKDYGPIDIVSKKIIESFDTSKVILVNRDNEKFPIEFKKLIDKRQLNLIDLSDILNEMKLQGVNPYFWEVTGKEGHWNNEAHRVIGESLAIELDKLLNK